MKIDGNGALAGQYSESLHVEITFRLYTAYGYKWYMVNCYDVID